MMFFMNQRSQGLKVQKAITGETDVNEHDWHTNSEVNGAKIGDL
jgi:hypothetical protein